MARIDSLNVLLTTTGNDELAEQYGAVIENVQKNTISSALKNTNLSGTPGAGTYEAKRFANQTSATYGTARTAHAGTAVKVKPVVVAIDTDKELITEVEEKDVMLYGVNDFIGKTAANDQKAMERELERAFFTEANTVGTSVTLTSITDPADQAEAMIQAVETVQNAFVDGVERDMIALVCAPAQYGKLRTYMDKVNDGGAAAESFGMFHGVRVYSSTYMPAGVKYICMAEGAIAQPVLPTVAPATKIPLSNAIGFGIFYSYGTKAVADDLIFKA